MGGGRMTASAYDWKRQRWIMRPHGVRWSEMLLGRRAVQAHLLQNGEATVSAYRTADGRIFYTDPVDPEGKPGPGVIYRIRVRIKNVSVTA